jgi:tetrapyrrole methylase family protein/MazG family protein
VSDSIFTGITITGLGPGDPALLTGQVLEWLSRQAEIFTSSAEHPALAALPQKVKIIPVIDENTPADFPISGEVTVEQVLDLARRPGGVTFATAGSSLPADPAAAAFIKQARTRGIQVRVLPGLGYAEYAVSQLGLEDTTGLSTVDASELARLHVPPQPGTVPLLITQLNNPELAGRIAVVLSSIYPADHEVNLISIKTKGEPGVIPTTLSQLSAAVDSGQAGLLYVPPMEAGSSFEDFQEVIARLRAPDGCPWDREQTHLSLRRHLLEETYEALEALDNEDTAKMSEEFGDLLLQIVLHAQIASEAGEFNMIDIVRGIHHKIIRRHPHVFGELQVGGVQGVLANWEKLKAAERAANGEETKGLLDGVPPALPALTQAQEIQERAARVGFDWPQIDGVLEKVGEEINELQTAESEDELAWELGDLLFAVVNVARWKKVDAETALRASSKRFRQRFAYIEHAARQQGRSVSELSFEEMDQLWEAAKK